MRSEARDMGKLIGMKNIGVDTAMKLYTVGIRDPRTLRRVGAKDAYQRISDYFSEIDSSLLGMLKGAIQGKRWFRL